MDVNLPLCIEDDLRSIHAEMILIVVELLTCAVARLPRFACCFFFEADSFVVEGAGLGFGGGGFRVGSSGTSAFRKA